MFQWVTHKEQRNDEDIREEITDTAERERLMLFFGSKEAAKRDSNSKEYEIEERKKCWWGFFVKSKIKFKLRNKKKYKKSEMRRQKFFYSRFQII